MRARPAHPRQAPRRRERWSRLGGHRRPQAGYRCWAAATRSRRHRRPRRRSRWEPPACAARQWSPVIMRIAHPFLEMHVGGSSGPRLSHDLQTRLGNTSRSDRWIAYLSIDELSSAVDAPAQPHRPRDSDPRASETGMRSVSRGASRSKTRARACSTVTQPRCGLLSHRSSTSTATAARSPPDRSGARPTCAPRSPV